MSKRIPKTIHRLLRDLDDHLCLVNDALARLNVGDAAYLKILAAELRVLTCLSNGTEGLLWRMVDELGVRDGISVHLAGNVNRSHPLARGASFVFVPIAKQGEGDPRLMPGEYSLRRIMKECEALVVLETGYTHEQLIKHVAQQMGSAHEDDNIDPHLVELDRTIVGNQGPLAEVLKSDAHFVLEVGRRVLERARESVGFSQQTRPNVVLSNEPAQQAGYQENEDSFQAKACIPPEGTIAFWIHHPDQDWATNNRTYRFGILKSGTIVVKPVKHFDLTIELTVEGLRAERLVSRQAIPHGDFPRVHVVIVWKPNEVQFYLNGQCVDSIPS